MGQKVHPYGFRVGITKPWKSKWVADKKDFGRFLVEDQKLKKFIRGKLKSVGLSKIEIERSRDELRVILYTAHPGKVIGRGGESVERLRSEIQSRVSTVPTVTLNIKEIANPELNAQVVAEAISDKLLRRGSFRREMKRALEATMDAGALGVKVRLAGRLAGSEIARSETAHLGSLPMHTLFADIDYGFHESHTTYGLIGVKVWIYIKSLLSENENLGMEPVAAVKKPRRGGRWKKPE